MIIIGIHLENKRKRKNVHSKQGNKNTYEYLHWRYERRVPSVASPPRN